MPRVAYRTLDLDTDAFTDVVPNDANFAIAKNTILLELDADRKNVADVAVAI